MLLDLIRGLGGRKEAPNQPGGRIDRQHEPQGPWTMPLREWQARRVQPRLYEALREAIPLIDSAINRLVTMDGILRFEAESDALQRAIEDWAEGVAVGDMQTGLQAYYTIAGNELYEQGFYVGEYVLAAFGRDVVRLNVADSKGVHFVRPAAGGPIQIWYRPPPPPHVRGDGTDHVESVLRNQYLAGSASAPSLQELRYRQLDPARLQYAGHQVEADNPYGVSLIRSLEFVGKLLLTMENAGVLTWERFGDPIFEITYKTRSKAGETTLEARRLRLAQNLAEAIQAKRQGKSADVVHAVGKDDEIATRVLGADGQVLEVEQPMRHVEEQIVGKSGLPAWMLGRHWSTAERLAQRQGEVVLQESRTRFELRRPGLRRIVEAALRARGITWRPGDWEVVQDLPSLQDLVAQAQAGFLEAQTEAMRAGAGQPQEAPEEDARAYRAGIDRAAAVVLPDPLQRAIPARRKQGEGEGEPWAEDDDALPALETRAVRSLRREWLATYERLLGILGLDDPGKRAKQDEPVFVLDPAAALPALRELETEFVRRAGAEDAELARAVYRAWLRGVANAADETAAEAEVLADEAREAYRVAAATRSQTLVRNVAVRALREDIARDLADGVYDGLNPRDVARRLRERFDVRDYDWLRLARSEITQAHALGKQDEYTAEGIERYDYVTAADSRVSSVCRANAAAGPYIVGSGPLPMRDSHPNCRCTIRAVVG